MLEESKALVISRQSADNLLIIYLLVVGILVADAFVGVSLGCSLGVSVGVSHAELSGFLKDLLVGRVLVRCSSFASFSFFASLLVPVFRPYIFL
jgi:hypothetical protein